MERRRKNDVARSLEAIESVSRAELNALFEVEFNRAPPPRTSLDLMRQNLAWAAQAKAAGDNPTKQRKQLTLALDRQINGKKPRVSIPYRPGTRLIREWHGKVYEVTVLDTGYAFEGAVYPNLSKIATRITGTRWSGPRFFGLTQSKANEK